MIKRQIYDSVFTNLFRDSENQLKAYQALHPEDTSVTIDDIRNVTLEAVFLDHIYNDLGFIVRDRAVFLIEAQSTWCENIAFRLLMYVADTLKEYAKDKKENYYGKRAIFLPRPEFYVLYTGDEEHEEEEISLADMHWNGDDSHLNLKVKVLRDNNTNNILAQYAKFVAVFKKNRSEYGNSKEAVIRTIEECKDGNILVDYLKRREKEVFDIMTSLYDFDYNLQMYGNSKFAEGHAEGRADRDTELIEQMLKNGRKPEEISKFCGYDLKQVQAVQEKMSVLH